MLTESKIVAGWKDLPKPGALITKSITMRVVGKSSVQKGNTKALMRFFLFNGEHYYRLIMWEARLFRENTTDLCDLYYQLKIGSVIRFFSLQVQKFYKDATVDWPDSLNQELEFNVLKMTTVKIVQEGSLMDVPKLCPFPPFWTKLTDVKSSSAEIAMRLLILGPPKKIKESKVDKVTGLRISVGDEFGSKAQLHVNVELDRKLDQENLDDIKSDTEIIVWGVSVRDDEGKVGFLAERMDYVIVKDEKTMQKLPGYNYVKMPTDYETPSKKRRSIL